MTLSEFIASLSAQEIVMASVFIGLLVAVITVFCHKYFIGKFVEFMAKNGIETPEGALPLAMLPCNFIVRSALKDGSTVRRLFGYVLGDEVYADPTTPLPRKNGRLELDEARFYLLPEKRAEATTRFSTKGNSPLALIVCIALLAAAYFLLKDFLPSLLDALINAYSAD